MLPGTLKIQSIAKNFLIKKQKENDLNSLSDSYIKALASFEGFMYIGNNLGSIDVMNEDTYEITHLDLRRVDPDFDYEIEQLVVYNNRVIIDTEGGGLFQYFTKTKKLKRLVIKGLEGVEVTKIIVDGSDLLYLTRNSIFRSTSSSTDLVFHNKDLDLNSIVRYQYNHLSEQARRRDLDRNRRWWPFKTRAWEN